LNTVLVFVAMAASLAAATLTVSGPLSVDAGKVTLVDEATKTTYELRGNGLRQLSQSRVLVTGDLVAGDAGATPIIVVKSATRLPVTAAAPGSAASSAKTGTSVSKVLIIGGIVGGVAAGALVGGLSGGDAPASRP
jgi:hypothetical protein